MKKWLIPAAAAGAGLAAAVLPAAYAVYRMAFFSPNSTQNDDLHLMRGEQMEALRDTVVPMIREQAARPYETVAIRSRDGLTLCGRYFHQRDGAPLCICFHGYRGTPTRDFAGGVALYRDAGFNLLMVEERAHCRSEGHTITFGIRERYDCLDWANYAVSRFGPDVRIVLAGIYMGAATILMASALPLPENVRGIVADAPFTSPKAIIRKVCGDLRVPPGLALPFLRLGARIFGGFDINDGDAAEAVTHSRVPILLIHGEDDRYVPCSMGRAIAAAAPDKVELHTFPGAGHGLSYLVDQPRYERIVRDFFARILPEETEHRSIEGFSGTPAGT